MTEAEATRERNRLRWRELAGGGNPIIALLDEAFSRPLDECARERLLTLPPSPLPQPERTAKRYYAYAGRLMRVAWAAADCRSCHQGRPDLMEAAADLMDQNLAGLDEEGFWARRGIGDPNTNRFVLMRVLEAARLLKPTPAGEQRWSDWREPLHRAVRQQRRAMAGDADLLEWDYGASKLGSYTNVDLSFMLVATLAAELLGDEGDRQAAGGLMEQVAASLMPDGGFHYTLNRNESPRYHNADVCFLGRYLTLTGNPLARRTLEATADYYPLSLTAEATPELWSAPWWKQHFVKQYGYPHDPTGLIVAAGVTGDPRNYWLMWRSLERTEPALPEGASLWLYAADYWPGLDRGAQPPPETWFAPDRNILGFRGRRRNWYYGLTQRRGLRNTFVGAILTGPETEPTLAAAVRGVQVHVLPSEGPELWLSGEDDPVAATQDHAGTGVVGASCRLQPTSYQETGADALPQSPWQATQVCYVGGDGVLAAVSLHAVSEAGPATVIGRVLLGPEELEQVDERAFLCGPLQALVLGASVAASAGHWGTNDDGEWPTLEFSRELGREVRAGEEVLCFAVWVSPAGETAPSFFARIAETAWRATRADREVIAAFNTCCAPSFRGQDVFDAPALNPARIFQISLMISEKQEGPFQLEIDWIAAYR